nr:uncharacterized mitochondrial protein AtMg00810-like [Tanacetum cinerariifolium]
MKKLWMWMFTYRSMIGSLMYLTASKPDIIFIICTCARFQVTPKVSHLHVVKRIFKYLKGQPKLGLWYPKDSPFDLKAFSDSDYAGASLDKKSTTGGCQFLDEKRINVNEASIIRDLKLQDAEVLRLLPGTNLVALWLLQSSVQVLDLEKARIAQAKEIADSSQEAREEEKVKDFMFKKIWKGRMNKEEMFGVDDLDGDEVIMDATASEEVKQSTKVAEKEVSTADPVTTAGEVVTTAKGVKVTTVATTPQISKDELTLAQTLIEIKAAKPKAITTAATTTTTAVTRPKARWVIVQEPSEFRTTSSLQPSQLPQAKDKGKRIMVETEKPLKKKDQISFNEEVARNLEAQMKAKIEEEESIAREKDEANIAVIEQ